MAWSSEQFVLHSHADLMGIMEITMVWEVGDPRKAFLYLIEQPCTSHAGVRAVLQAHQATPTFGDLSLFSPPSGIFFPQISTWVALRGKKKGRKDRLSEGERADRWGTAALFLWQAGYEGHTNEGEEYSLGKEEFGGCIPWFSSQLRLPKRRRYFCRYLA